MRPDIRFSSTIPFAIHRILILCPRLISMASDHWSKMRSGPRKFSLYSTMPFQNADAEASTYTHTRHRRQRPDSCLGFIDRNGCHLDRLVSNLPPIRESELLGGPAELLVLAIKDDKGSLEGDIAENGEADAAVILDTAVAAAVGAVHGCVVDVAARNGDGGLADAEAEVGKVGVTGEDVTAVNSVVAGSLNGGIVSVDDVSGEKHQGRASVGDAGDGVTGVGVGANLVAGRVEGPETVGAVDGDVLDVTRVGGLVDEAEVVSTGCGRVRTFLHGMQ